MKEVTDMHPCGLQLYADYSKFFSYSCHTRAFHSSIYKAAVRPVTIAMNTNSAFTGSYG